MILHEVSESEKPELHTVFAGAPCPHLHPPSQAHFLIHSIFLFLLIQPLERPNEAGAVVALLIYLCLFVVAELRYQFAPPSQFLPPSHFLKALFLSSTGSHLAQS